MDWPLIEQKLESLRRSILRVKENWAIVFAIATAHLQDFEEFAKAVARMNDTQ